jgi:hypothetical protein
MKNSAMKPIQRMEPEVKTMSGQSVDGNARSLYVTTRKKNLDMTRLARNTLLDDFIRQTKQERPRMSFPGATYEMRKHLEIWGEKNIKDLDMDRTKFINRLAASARTFAGIFDPPGGSKVIHPLSYFWISCQIFSGLLILFMCIESPAILAFYWSTDACAVFPTRALSLAIEVAFLIEIVLRFFVGYYDDISGNVLLICTVVQGNPFHPFDDFFVNSMC